MLNQLQFKLQVEEQYKLGIEKMAQAYRIEGDKRLRSETDSKRQESEGKIQLLRKAKRRYETLAKFGAAVEEDEGTCGKLYLGLLSSFMSQTYRRMESGKTPYGNLSLDNSSFPFDQLVTLIIDHLRGNPRKLTTKQR